MSRVTNARAYWSGFRLYVGECLYNPSCLTPNRSADEVIKVTNAFSLRFPTHSFDSHLAAIQPKRLQDPAIAAEVARMYGE